MNRNLHVKRIYSMGNYNNVELMDEISDIPQNVVLSPNATGLLYYLMILEQEKAHKRYLQLYKSYPASPEQIDQTFEIIERERTRTFQEFVDELNKDLNKEN